MKIAVLLDEQYPNGMASANRTHLYSKGLTGLGNNVEIFIPRATEGRDKIRNTEKQGTYDGVKFRYACDPVISSSFVARRFQNMHALINTITFLLKFRPDIIVIAANNFKYILQGKVCAILTNAKLVREKSEVPFYKAETLTPEMQSRIRNEFRLFDGMIVISDSLKRFFHDDLDLKIEILEVPIIIENRNESVNKQENVNVQNLVYTGSMLEHKDGVTTIIKAFARIKKEFPALMLVMTGDIRKSENQNAIFSLIEDHGLKNSINLTGYIPREDLENLTSSAFALLLAKPRNRQNQYNMATKIGEYLLSGRPAVISSVDPSCRYLKHRENVCISEPNEESLAGEIRFLIQNKSAADSIGAAGRESAMKLFDYRTHCKRINDFFLKLLKEKKTD